MEINNLNTGRGSFLKRGFLNLGGFSTSRLSRNSLSKYAGFLVLGVVLIGALAWGSSLVSGLNKGSGILGTDQKYKLKEARATQVLNQEYLFPIKDNKNQEVAKLKYLVESAEIRDEIIVKGKKASSVQGRTFLVLNLKIQNDFSKAIEITTRDYIRLVINGNEAEQLAADIHNDPVSIQPISTKYTRLAFPIDDDKKQLKLLVGEIKGEKKPLDLSLNF